MKALRAKTFENKDLMKRGLPGRHRVNTPARSASRQPDQGSGRFHPQSR